MQKLMMIVLIVALLIERRHGYTNVLNQITELTANDLTSFTADLGNWAITNLINANVKYYVCASNYIMGGYGVTNAYATYSRIYNNLPAHTGIYYSFTLYTLDSMDNTATAGYDTLNIYFDTVKVTTWLEDQTTYSSAGSTCGNTAYSDLISSMYGTIPHSLLSLTLKFESYTSEDSLNESFGFRNLKIQLVNAGATVSQSLCGINTYIPSANRCLCAAGQYPDINSNCQSCSNECAACIGTQPYQCTQCKSQYVFNGLACILPCAAGSYYQRSVNSCQACPVDTYESGSNTDAICNGCPIGANTNGLTGQTACNYCSPGYYMNSLNGNVCTKCPVDTYMSTINSATSCIKCPSSASTSILTGATALSDCKYCKKGTYMEPVNALVYTGKRLRKRSFYCF
jgi:hypothetical protein